MSLAAGLRFGPIALRVEGSPLPPLFAAHRATVGADARRVVVTLADALPAETAKATAEMGFALVAHADHDELTLRGDSIPQAPWLAALCEIVARDATRLGAVLLHAGAVTVAGGVALLVAPPGVGKTTAVRAAGERAFASNSVLLEVTGRAVSVAWAMPFNRELTPGLESAQGLPVAAVAFVHRAPEASVEWISGPRATIRLMPHVTRPRGDDPHLRARTNLALSLGGRVRALTLGLPWGPGYLAALDAALHLTT